jgi:hypothetical protein
MKKITAVVILFLGFALAVPAQRNTRVVKAKRTPAIQRQEANSKLYQQMLPATAKVMFFDSIVVNKSDFLDYIPVSKEIGTLAVNAGTDFANHMVSYQNEFGDRRIVAQGDSSASRLYTQTLVGDQWSKKSAIADFDPSTYSSQNYPFLASDGVTLYFSACGPESLGKRDIFMSSFDSDNAQWYKPQNCGLPFNSTANDYLLVIDDLDSLGWLVSDRYQPEGKVCVYSFVPTASRQSFDNDGLSDAQLKHYADIRSIKDTWKFGNRKKALASRDALWQRIKAKQRSAEGMAFVVDDNTVITSPSQFRNSQSRQLYKQVVELKTMISQTQAKLDAARIAYHNGNRGVADNILRLEQQLPQQQNDLRTIEQKIRQLELNH